MRNKDWYKLDNMGRFYSSISNKKIPAVFRFSATLNEEINGEFLQIALDETIDLFPNFNVNLKRGVFWHYLEYTKRRNIVSIENRPICSRLYVGNESFLYRVNYYKNRINLEMSHILSDGRGCLDFFKILISNYLKLTHPKEIIEIDYDSSDYEKNEDSFDKYYQREKLKTNIGKKVYKFRAPKLINETRYMELHLSAKKVLEIAHSYNTTLTVLFISVLLDCFKKELKIRDLNKTIHIDVPVDLRSYFQSTTAKNFFGITAVEYKFKSKDDSFEDIIKSVHEQLKKGTTKENIIKRVNNMVSLEKNPIVRIAPLFIKDIILNFSDTIASNRTTSCVSNLGKIKTDPALEKYLKEINVLSSTKSFQFTICTYKDDLSIGISSVYKYNNIIKDFCRYFTINGSYGYLNTNVEETI